MKRTDVEIVAETWLHRSFLKVKHYRLRHKLFSGGWSEVIERELIARPRVAAVLPYDPVLDKVVLVEQFRPGALEASEGPWLMEVVAGVAEGQESPQELAHRETFEETGLTVQKLQLIYNYWVSPGMCNEQVALFCAKVDASNAGGIYGLADENEDIQTHVMTAEEAFALVAAGRLNNAMSLIALQWLQLHKKALQASWR